MGETILQAMEREKLIAIVRGVAVQHMEPVMEALLQGGIHMVEITYDHHSEESRRETLKALELVRNRFEGRLYLGVGTALTPRDVEDAQRAGAQYVISPDVNEQVIERTRELGLVSMPGALTPTEIAKAYACGANIVKLFPASALGVSYIKSIKGPLGFIPLAAVGGVTPESIPQFLQAGISCFGIGGNLVNAAKVAAGDFDSIQQAASRFAQAVVGC